MEEIKLIHRPDGQLVPDDPYAVVGTTFRITGGDPKVIYKVHDHHVEKRQSEIAQEARIVYGKRIDGDEREVEDTETYCVVVTDGRKVSPQQ